LPSQLLREAIEVGERLKERLADSQHRFRDRQQPRRVLDELQDPRFERSFGDTADPKSEDP